MTVMALVGAALLLVSGALYLAARKSGALLAGAAGMQALATLTVVVGRGDLPPAGWASVLALAALVSGALVFGLKRAEYAPAQGVLTLLAAACAAAPQGPGVAMWSGWAIPHIVLASLALGAAGFAAVISVSQLRGRVIGLTALALVITALPYFSERSASVAVANPGGPATVKVELTDPAGDQGLVVSLIARAALPGERPLRALVILAMLAALGLAIGRRSARLVPHHALIGYAVMGICALHVLWLSSSLIGRDLGVDEAALEQLAAQTVDRSGAFHETAIATAPQGPYTGHAGAPYLPLSLGLVSLGLLACGWWRPPETDPSDNGLESRAVAAATILLAGAAATGMVWSNFNWGGRVIPDPKLFASLVVLVLYGVYFTLATGSLRAQRAPSWIALGAFFVLLLSMMGPELGWTAPTLHHFGP